MPCIIKDESAATMSEGETETAAEERDDGSKSLVKAGKAKKKKR